MTTINVAIEKVNDGAMRRVFGVDFVEKEAGLWMAVEDDDVSPGNLSRATGLIVRGGFGSLSEVDLYVSRLIDLSEKGYWIAPPINILMRFIGLSIQSFRG